MDKIGTCVDDQGRISPLYCEDNRYYRENPKQSKIDSGGHRWMEKTYPKSEDWISKQYADFLQGKEKSTGYPIIKFDAFNKVLRVVAKNLMKAGTKDKNQFLDRVLIKERNPDGYELDLYMEIDKAKKIKIKESINHWPEFGKAYKGQCRKYYDVFEFEDAAQILNFISRLRMKGLIDILVQERNKKDPQFDKDIWINFLYGEKLYANPPSFNAFNLPSYFENVKKGRWRALTKVEQRLVRQRFGSNLKCSFAFDQGKYRKARRKKGNGYFCYTHRARSPGYPTIDKIPKEKYKFIASTG